MGVIQYWQWRLRKIVLVSRAIDGRHSVSIHDSVHHDTPPYHKLFPDDFSPLQRHFSTTILLPFNLFTHENTNWRVIFGFFSDVFRSTRCCITYYNTFNWFLRVFLPPADRKISTRTNTKVTSIMTSTSNGLFSIIVTRNVALLHFQNAICPTQGLTVYKRV